MNFDQSTRRQMLGLGIASVGALALSHTAKAQEDTAAGAMKAPMASDTDLLRTSMLVEQVGAAYYAQVMGAQNARAYLPSKVITAVMQMAQTKSAHVTAIAGALSDTGVSPLFKFPTGAFISKIGMPWLGFTLEEIAIGAHLTTLDSLQMRSLRPVVAGIIGANSGHAALLRTLVGTEFSPRYFEAKLSPDQVQKYMSAYLG
jgi:hypothetical protein